MAIPTKYTVYYDQDGRTGPDQGVPTVDLTPIVTATGVLHLVAYGTIVWGEGTPEWHGVHPGFVEEITDIGEGNCSVELSVAPTEAIVLFSTDESAPFFVGSRRVAEGIDIHVWNAAGVASDEATVQIAVFA